ncbi:uncharacterized, partial [Tachysurus ichikawai]
VRLHDFILTLHAVSMATLSSNDSDSKDGWRELIAALKEEKTCHSGVSSSTSSS